MTYYKFRRRLDFPPHKILVWFNRNPHNEPPQTPPYQQFRWRRPLPPHKRPPNEGHLLRGGRGGGIFKGGRLSTWMAKRRPRLFPRR